MILAVACEIGRHRLCPEMTEDAVECECPCHVSVDVDTIRPAVEWLLAQSPGNQLAADMTIKEEEL